MRRASALFALGLALAPLPVLAQAVDWNVNARLRQSFEAESNRGLRAGGGNEVAGARTGVDIIIGGVTKTSVTQINIGLSGSLFTGAASEGLDIVEPTLDASHSFRVRDYQIGTTASFRRRALSEEQLEDTGETVGGGTQITGALGLSVALNADARNRYSISTNARFTEFSGTSGANVTPTRSIGLSAAWLHQVNRLNSISLSSGVSLFEADSPTGTDSRSINVSAGLQHRRTSRHTINADAGLSAVFQDRPNGGDDLRVAATGGAALSYRGGEMTGNLSLNQSVDSSNTGEVRQFTRLAGDLNYPINDHQRISFGASYSLRSDVGFGGEKRQVFSIGPQYFFTLTKEAALSLGYLFRVGKTDGQSARTSHRVQLTLSRALSILP